MKGTLLTFISSRTQYIYIYQTYLQYIYIYICIYHTVTAFRQGMAGPNISTFFFHHRCPTLRLYARHLDVSFIQRWHSPSRFIGCWSYFSTGLYTSQVVQNFFYQHNGHIWWFPFFGGAIVWSLCWFPFLRYTNYIKYISWLYNSI